jgi:hypothetical protein
MKLLRLVLYWEAAAVAAGGIVLAVAPRFVLQTLMDQAPARDYAWMRIVGIQAVALSMLMVLVGQAVEDRWIWAWVFPVVGGAVAALAALNATVSVPSHSAAGPWWAIAGLAAASAAALVLAIGRAGMERPPDIKQD